MPASADARGGGVAAADWRDLSWGDTFQQYSLTHLVVVVLCALVIWAVVATGRRQRRLSNLARDEADGPGRVLGALLTVYWLIYQLWWSFPQRPLARDSWLPLHLCDLAGLVAGLALLTGRRWLTTTLYFWAFAFSTQAFITPIVREGPATARFWMFWESHTAIIGAAVYAVVVRGYRPGARDFRFGILASLAYVAVVLPLNLAFGWNYGYVGPTSPQVPTIVDRLGPWPWRLLPIAGLAVGAMLIVWLPWLVAERFGGQRASEPARARRRTAGAPSRGGQ